MSVLAGNPSAVEPPEVLELALCEKFNWTVTDLYAQPANTITRFLQILKAREENEKITGNLEEKNV